MSDNDDLRLRNLADEGRRPRGAALSAEERDKDIPRELSDAERVDAFRKRSYQSVLPDIPAIPGYRCIWLNPESTDDPVADRMAFGYEPVLKSDIPHWRHPMQREGANPEHVFVREMQAFKLKEHLWRQFMSHNHHERPLAEDQKLLDTAKALKSPAGATVPVIEDEGQRDIRQQIRDRRNPFGF